METFKLIIIIAFLSWISAELMTIVEYMRTIKFKQGEIYLLLEYYLRKREIEKK